MNGVATGCYLPFRNLVLANCPSKVTTTDTNLGKGTCNLWVFGQLGPTLADFVCDYDAKVSLQ